LAASVTDTASLVYGIANAVEYIGLPEGSGSKYNDPSIRVALSQAIDRTQLVRDVFGPSTTVATGFEPPALAISEGPSLQGKKTKGAPLEPCGPNVPATPDLEAAKAKLKTLRALTLEVNDDGVYPALADALATQWRALGLTVTVAKVPWDAYIAKASSPTGFETPFRIRWSTDAVVPITTYNNRQSYLGSLLSTGSTAYGNLGHWTDRPFDFALDTAIPQLTEVQQRAVAFNAVDKHLCDQMPIIPLVFDRPTFLVRSGVVGAARQTPVGRNGVLSLRELYLKAQS
jgi:oligopeptide transport system substrate-binding protein